MIMQQVIKHVLLNGIFISPKLLLTYTANLVEDYLKFSDGKFGTNRHDLLDEDDK